MPDFLKVHSITFNLNYPQNMGGGVDFALLKENKSEGDPHFLFFYLKCYIKVYEIKAKL